MMNGLIMMKMNINTELRKLPEGFGSWINKLSTCRHREHDFPSMLYVRPGHTITHTCPNCGHQTSCTGPETWC